MFAVSDTSPLYRVARGYVRLIEIIAIVGISVMTVVAAVQVFYRYVLNDSLFWSEELMRYLMAWVAFLTAGMAYSRGELMGMRFIVEALPSPVQRVIDFISRILITIFLATVAWYGYQYAVRTSMDEAIALEFSLFWVHVSVAVGAVILIMHVVFAEVMRSVVAAEKSGEEE